MLNQHNLDLQLKISIGLRLFLVVLISIVSVVTLSLLLMREKVAENFSSYAVKIEFDRLQGLYQGIQERFTKDQNWKFIEDSPNKRKDWLIQELSSLNQQQKPPTTTYVQADAVSSKRAVTPQLQNSKTRIYEPHNGNLPPLPPPSPPEPPAPPLPPAPPEQASGDVAGTNHKVSSRPHQGSQITPVASTSINSNDLFQRISLLDSDGSYLAGKIPKGEASTARPILVDSKIVGFLVISHPQLPSDVMAQEFIEAQKNAIGLLLVMSVALSALVAVALARHFRYPILQLVAGAEQLELGNFEARLAENRSDELGRLAHSFNQLAQKLDEVERQRRQWVADTSHELRTPISVMRAQLEALQDGIRPSNTDNLALLHRQVMSLNKLIDELYTLARADIGALEYHFEICDLRELLREVIKNFEEKLARTGLVYEIQTCDTPAIVNADIERLRQVCVNLIENSIRYTHTPGVIRLSLDATASMGTHVQFIIEDSPPGVPEEALRRLSERFFRLDNSRSRESGGAGLGLALCHRIIEAHQGKISFSRSNLGGLKVEILFKLAMKEEKSV